MSHIFGIFLGSKFMGSQASQAKSWKLGMAWLACVPINVDPKNMANFYFDFPACVAKLIFQMAFPLYMKIGPIEASVSMSNFRLELKDPILAKLHQFSLQSQLTKK